jgi:hypothetical protein
VDAETHAALNALVGRLINMGTRPGLVSKGHVVELAVKALRDQMLPPGAEFCTTCAKQLPDHEPGCFKGMAAKPDAHPWHLLCTCCDKPLHAHALGCPKAPALGSTGGIP